MDFFFIKWYWTHIYNQLRNAYSIYYTWTNLQFMLLFIECSKTWCVIFSPLIAFIYVICACLRLVVSNTSWLCKLHGGCLITDSNCLPFANTCGYRRFLMGSVLLSRTPVVTAGFWWGCVLLSRTPVVTAGFWWGSVLLSRTPVVTAGFWWGPCCSREHLWLPPVFDGVRVAHRFSFLCCVVSLCFVCLLPVSRVLKVACVSGLSILGCHFRFSLTFISIIWLSNILD